MKNVFVIVFSFCFLLSGCKERYLVQSVESSRMEIDSTWDAKVNPQMVALVNSYKMQLDSELNAEIGTAAQTLYKGYPQSLLTNFTADAMQETGETLWGHVDFAVMNVGGLRSTLNEGVITVKNMYEIYSFDNRLVLLELPGKAVRELFDFITFRGGQGLSNGVRLEAQNQQVTLLEIGGQPVDDAKIYRVVTIDYLARGNDGMTAFEKAVGYTDSNHTLRDYMIQYIKDLTAKNLKADAKMDHRITLAK